MNQVHSLETELAANGSSDSAVSPLPARTSTVKGSPDRSSVAVCDDRGAQLAATAFSAPAVPPSSDHTATVETDLRSACPALRRATGARTPRRSWRRTDPLPPRAHLRRPPSALACLDLQRPVCCHLAAMSESLPNRLSFSFCLVTPC